MIRSIKYDSIRKIIVLCCNFLRLQAFIETYFKQCKRNECIMFLQKRRKKKRLRENTIIGRNYDLECNTVTQHRDLAPFLFCALFALRPFVLRPFSLRLFVAVLLSAPFLPRQMSCFVKSIH